MPDYQKGKIYKIVSPHTDKIYIGSTCKEYLSQRLAKHKSDFKVWLKNGKHNVTSYRLLELGEVEILLLETYPCNSKDELISRERHWYDLNKELSINKNRSSISNEEKIEFKNEHYIKNKEHYSQLHRQYCENHKDEIKQYRKEYDKEYRKIKYDCECGSKNISYEQKSRHIKSDKHQTYLMIQTL
jgi:hypothetical protein